MFNSENIFGPLSAVKGNPNATAHKNIFECSVFPTLWQLLARLKYAYKLEVRCRI